MKDSFKVLWTDVAESDLVGIIDYIAHNNPETSKKILRKFKKKANSLKNTPQRGRVVPELMNQGLAQYREMIVSPWRIIYRIGDDKVIVLAVVDSRRNLEDLLLQRFISNS